MSSSDPSPASDDAPPRHAKLRSPKQRAKIGSGRRAVDLDIGASGDPANAQIALTALARARREIGPNGSSEQRVQYQLARAQVHAMLDLAEALRAGKE